MVVQVKIVGEVNANKAVYYVILVKEDSRQWIVRRRYSEFAALDAKLALQSSSLNRLPLPRKGFFGFRHRFNIGQFNDDRKKTLSRYLQELVGQISIIIDNVFLSAFLQPPTKGAPEEFLTFHTGEGSSFLDIDISTSSVRSGRSSARLRVLEEKTPRTPRVRAKDGKAKDADKTKSGPDAVMDRQPSRGKKSVRIRPVGDNGILNHPDWEVFGKEHPQLSDTMMDCSFLLFSSKRFENENETVFRWLRRQMLHLGSESIHNIPGKIIVWEFLLMVAAARPFLRRQVEEVITVLESSTAWCEALGSREDLLIARGDLFNPGN